MRDDDAFLKRIFFDARTHNEWLDKDIPEETLRDLFDLLKWGPTSANCLPARFVFVTSDSEKHKLANCADDGNREKILQAPVTCIIAYDEKFYDELPRLFPHNPDARSWFADSPSNASQTAFRNATLQGGYFIIAARALGLDCGPMSGFDENTLNEAFLERYWVESEFHLLHWLWQRIRTVPALATANIRRLLSDCLTHAI